MREPHVEGEAPVGRVLLLAPFENLQRFLRMMRRLSEDQAAEKIGDLELRVEVRNDVQQFVQAVVLPTGHLPVSRHLDRLEPGDVGQNVPEPERELRPPADGSEQPRRFPDLPAGLRQARRGSRRHEKPMETRSAKAAAHPHAPLDASFIPAGTSPCLVEGHPSLSGFHHGSGLGRPDVDTIQRARAGRKVVHDTTPRGAEAPLGVALRKFLPALRLCPVVRPDEEFLVGDHPAVEGPAVADLAGRSGDERFGSCGIVDCRGPDRIGGMTSLLSYFALFRFPVQLG